MSDPGTPSRLSFVTLGAHDHPALRRFYVGVGFEDRTPNVDTKEEVDGAWQHWVDAGATPIHEPVDGPVGVRSGYVADPEGNRWEIAWAPGMEFDGRGAISRFGS